jgi:arylsulfatase A-like enzyme
MTGAKKNHDISSAPTTATGGITGAVCGMALAVVELATLSWNTSVPWEIAAAIAAIDVTLLTAVGLIAAWVFRRSEGVGFAVSAATVSAAIFPTAAGTLMKTGFVYAAVESKWLPVATVGGALLMAVVGGVASAVLLRWWIPDRAEETWSWEPWALGCLVFVASAELAALANSAFLRPLLSVRCIVGNVLLAFVTLGTLRGLLLVQRRMPSRLTFVAAVSVGSFVWLSAVLHETRPPARKPEPHSRPNVILMTLDTLRADHMSAYGYVYKTTPNLDQFAAHAELFEHAVSPSTWTLPVHASLFTGMSLRRHGLRDRTTGRGAGNPAVARLSPDIPTLAEILAKHGYATGAFIANCRYLTADTGLARGFGTYIATPRAVAVVRPAFGSVISAMMPERYAAFIRPFRPAHKINDAALGWIDEQGRRPFFLFLNYMETHWPYEAPPPYHDQFPGTLGIRSDFRVPWDWYQRLLWAMHEQGGAVTAAERRHLSASYDAALAYLDKQLGEFFDALKQRGLYEGSLIIVTSDHGELFGVHHLIGHGADPYEGVTHVPLLIRYPGSNRPQRASHPVSTRRLFALILQQAGVTDGAGATQSVHGGEPVISEAYTLRVRDDPNHSRTRRAIYEGSLKLIASPEGDRVLYDVAADPMEQTDLSRRLPQVQADLSARLDAWLESEPEAGTARSTQDPDAAVLDGLRALGYVQ